MSSDDIEVTVFSESDLKKDGKLKVKNNAVVYTGKKFKEYVKANNLTLSKGYVDLVGFLSNGKRFKCRYGGMVIGVTGIIDDINNNR
jgi:hypothetical protein